MIDLGYYSIIPKGTFFWFKCKNFATKILKISTCRKIFAVLKCRRLVQLHGSKKNKNGYDPTREKF